MYALLLYYVFWMTSMSAKINGPSHHCFIQVTRLKLNFQEIWVHDQRLSVYFRLPTSEISPAPRDLVKCRHHSSIQQRQSSMSTSSTEAKMPLLPTDTFINTAITDNNHSFLVAEMT